MTHRAVVTWPRDWRAWMFRRVRNPESKVIAWTPEDERLLRERVQRIQRRAGVAK